MAQNKIKADPAKSPADTAGQGQGGSVISRDTATVTPTAKDTAITPAKAADTTIRLRDTTVQVKDTVISLADDVDKKPAVDTTTKKPVVASAKTDSALAKTDKPAEDSTGAAKGKVDNRWFIAPATRFQYQDFGMIEKNRKGYLSDADKLPLSKRGNGSFAVSAYRNITQRLSLSADIGLSFGHATTDNVLISQTKSKTFNLLNAALYYHLLDQSAKVQPYITVGINDIVNDKSYTSIPVGIGAKYTGKKVMVTGQLTYGAAMNKGVANSTMYSLGVYIPIKNNYKHKPKQKNGKDSLDNSPYNRKSKDDDKKKDSTSKGGVTNNIYITINMDSVLKAKGLLDDNGKPRHSSGDDDDDDGSESGRKRRSRKPFRSLGLDDFGDDEYRIDSMGGKPTLRFVVYFEFNEYGLNSSAFGKIDKVIEHLRRSQEFYIEIKGYTDSIGNNTYNNWLSRRRANMVKDYINSRGVPHEWMKAKAYGSDNPVGDNSDPNQQWLNRRAEIIVHRKDALEEGSEK